MAKILQFCVFACVGISYLSGLTEAVNATDTVKFRLYFKNLTYVEVQAKNGVQLVPHMNKTECTQFYAHGYIQSLDDYEVSQVTQGLVKQTTCNIIGIDYRYITFQLYATAVELSNAVAEVVVPSIQDMVAAGVDQSTLTVSGFSLGGQLSGDIGRRLSFKLPYLLALDPAGPQYGNQEPSVSATDASCVQCISTNAGYFGSNIPCGHLFLVNGGVQQNGCALLAIDSEIMACSHRRAQYYMVESLENPDSFLGIKCNSYDDFKAGNCDNSTIISMGRTAPCSAPAGLYFLQTNAKSPFGRGLKGTVYDPSVEASDVLYV